MANEAERVCRRSKALNCGESLNRYLRDPEGPQVQPRLRERTLTINGVSNTTSTVSVVTPIDIDDQDYEFRIPYVADDAIAADSVTPKPSKCPFQRFTPASWIIEACHGA